jgi:hypothetical protein
MKLGNLPPFFAIFKAQEEVKRLLRLMDHQGDEYRYLAIHTYEAVPEQAYGMNEWHVDAPLYRVKVPESSNKNGFLDYRHELQALREKLLYQLECGYHYEVSCKHQLPSGLTFLAIRPPMVETPNGNYSMADLSVDDLSKIVGYLGFPRKNLMNL